MIKFLIRAISRGLGFTKTESRGTLILIFVIIMALIISHYRISMLKSPPVETYDSTLMSWTKEVQASYARKPVEQPAINQRDFLPIQTLRPTKVRKNTHQPHKNDSISVTEIVVADINTATPQDLEKVHGIGPTYAARIVKYRELLGGFSSPDQLFEVYGLPQETVEEALKYFQVRSDVIPIDLNTDSIKILARHPYISYDLARVIINYRKIHGNFNHASELKKIKALDEATFLRIKPYLK